MASEFTIGALAKAVGVNIETIRYYERRKLLAAPLRKPSGYRVYGEESLRRLRFIRNAQSLGFTLREIAELLTLRVSSSARSEAIRGRAQAKLDQVEAKMRDLRALARALRTLMGSCQAGQATDRCSILKAMDQERRGHHGSSKKTF